eukprot:c13830_g1_i1 orf=848-1111(-)
MSSTPYPIDLAALGIFYPLPTKNGISVTILSGCVIKWASISPLTDMSAALVAHFHLLLIYWAVLSCKTGQIENQIFHLKLLMWNPTN